MRKALILDLVILHAVLGWILYTTQSQNFRPAGEISQALQAGNNQIIKTEYLDKCGIECQKYIDSKLNIPTPTPSTITKTVYQQVSKPKTKSIVYVPITGSGNTTNNDWTSVSGTDFYLDKADYKGLQEISFEGNLKLFNGNGIAYMRLFDVTHGIAVQGSDAQTSSQISTPVNSNAINLWSGKNLYRVQLKSLTADTAVFDGGKLKITVLN
ncbi:hypothetical protein HZB69_04400 [Candidatus Amesbacteria bacterium]|nr:hypothetical protein [Candidatus Amesbacteria bacterium]